MILKDLMKLSEYARHRKARGLPGGTTQSVLNAVNAGRIPTVTVGKDKLVNPIAADRAWLMNTDCSRYSPEQLAAMEGEPVNPDRPANDRLIGQAEALCAVHQNAPILASVLVRSLNITPLEALSIASEGIFSVTLGCGELFNNSVFLEHSHVPEWAIHLSDGAIQHPTVRKALEDIEWFVKETSHQEEEELDLA